MNEIANPLKRAALELQEAKTTLEEAKYLMEGYYYKGAARCLYFSMFHGVCALFAKDGIRSKTHKGSHITFIRDYTFPGKFPEKFSKLYAQLQTIREAGDYDAQYTTSGNQVLGYISDVESFLEKVFLYKGVVNNAVDAVIERVIEQKARAFTPNQLKCIHEYAKTVENGALLKQHYEKLWEMAKDVVNTKNSLEIWKEDVHQELLALTIKMQW